MRTVFPALLMILAAPAAAQESGASPSVGEASGYYIIPLAERRVTTLPEGPVYWRVETFATAEAARAAQGSYALLADVAGRHWLFTLGPPGGAGHGARVAEIGPVAIPSAATYLLRINHAGGPPGSQTPVHTHPGSESIYVLAGRISQRTPHGMMRAEAGGTLNAHAPDMVMQITSTGAVDLEQLVMFVVDADRPFSVPARFQD